MAPPDERPLSLAHPLGGQAKPTRAGFLRRLCPWLTLSVIAIITAAVLVPALTREVDPPRSRINCLGNLDRIFRALAIYADQNHGVLPLEPEPAVRAEWKGFASDVMQCPAGAANGDGAYIYVPGHDGRSRPDEVIMYEPVGRHDRPGGSVLFVDGHVKFLDPTDHEAAIARTTARLAERTYRPPSTSHGP